MISPLDMSRSADFSESSKKRVDASLKKLWSPLNTADYAPYVAQIPECDVVCVGLAGSNPIKFIKQAKGLGIKQQLVGGSTTADDTIIQAYGEEAQGLINTNPYSLDIDSEANKRFIAAMRKNYGADVRIGHYAACFYIDGQVIEAALAKTGGTSDNPDEADTPRGPISFDDHGNVVTDVYVRRAEKQGDTQWSTRPSRPITRSANSGPWSRPSS